MLRVLRTNLYISRSLHNREFTVYNMRRWRGLELEGG